MGADRIKELRAAAALTIYTPGSTAGVPLNVVGSLQAPKLSWDTETETLREEIEGVVTSVLRLAGIDAEPLSSREHVLLSNLIENAWRSGRDLDLGSLIGEIQSPPLRKLGVFEVDAFFPPKERTELALRLNSLIAAPSFAAWGEGAALDRSRCSTRPTGSRGRRSSTWVISTTRSGSSSSHSCSRSSSPGCAASPAPRISASSRIWTRSSASSRRRRRRPRRSRS
jgi:hypothetical protein